MAVIKKSALVSHPVSDMFDIVNDIESYPEFLPWCGGSEINKREGDEVEASIKIAHNRVRKTFTTRNRVQKNKMIEVQLVDGPFKHLHGFWQFMDLGGKACKITFDLEYEFSSRLIDMSLGPVFSKIANSMVDAFCKRADELHGNQSGDK